MKQIISPPVRCAHWRHRLHVRFSSLWTLDSGLWTLDLFYPTAHSLSPALPRWTFFTVCIQLCATCPCRCAVICISIYLL